ncbi:MAG: hypothetical protein WBB04_03165 [Candidatus Macondimonas sp.]
MGMRLKLLAVAVGALTLLPAHAALTPMADAELRMVSGRADVGKLIYDPPPVVVKLDILAQNLETAGHPIAATLVARQARFLYGLLDGCPRGAMCTM